MLFAVDIVANKLYLYWTYTWLDKTMHVMGGFAAGLLGLICYEYMRRKPGRLLTALIGALIIGSMWELLEYILHISRLGPQFLIDTASDLTMDIIGGLIAYLIWKKLPQRTQQQ
jgi:hypothetical protein